MKALLFIIVSFFGSSIALADDVEHVPLVEFEMEEQDLLDDRNCRNRIFAQYSRKDFKNIGQVRGWCRGFLTDFGLDFGRLDEFCGWERRGSYGRYTWNARFVYPGFSYGGQPQFYSRPFCG